jgi:hypothetical protein
VVLEKELVESIELALEGWRNFQMISSEEEVLEAGDEGCWYSLDLKDRDDGVSAAMAAE